jgi:uncharacterized protein YdhG (YjbR/CyaY superfamily)/predicted lactoylglutathione lyase
MTSIESITLEVADPTAANRFCTAAFGLGAQVRVRASEAPTTGFRGFTLSLLVSQPATVNSLISAALDAGATPLKPAAKSLWGYGGVVQAPDGTIWTVASSAKKDIGPATRQIDEIVLQLGVADVAASKQFYVDRGLTVTKNYGRNYVEFATPSSPVKLTLYRRRALAKVAGVFPDGTGSHRLVIGSDAGPLPTRTGSRGRPPRPESGDAARLHYSHHIDRPNPPPIRNREEEETSMKDTKSAKNTTTTGNKSEGFSDEERAAMKERAQELKATARRGPRGDKTDGERDLLAKITEMPEQDRAMAERLHAIITASAPELSPKTWYGMPAYANKDGKVVCYFTAASKFKERYATFGFNPAANLDEGTMWPTSFALTELTTDNEARIGALVKKAVS